jgi:hypothetical protein
MRPPYMAVLLKTLNISSIHDETDLSSNDEDILAAAGKSEHPGCHRRLAGGGLATHGAVMALYRNEAHAASGDNAA